ncbi:unnamed protein product, partial [Amoebophrya sp. A120]
CDVIPVPVYNLALPSEQSSTSPFHVARSASFASRVSSQDENSCRGTANRQIQKMTEICNARVDNDTSLITPLSVNNARSSGRRVSRSLNINLPGGGSLLASGRDGETAAAGRGDSDSSDGSPPIKIPDIDLFDDHYEDKDRDG